MTGIVKSLGRALSEPFMGFLALTALKLAEVPEEVRTCAWEEFARRMSIVGHEVPSENYDRGVEHRWVIWNL